MSTNQDPSSAGGAPSPDQRALSVSPSLRHDSPGAIALAFEVKFLLDEGLARGVEEHLAGALLPDPHSDPTLGGMYSISNLALDSPDLGVFYRDWRMKNRKCRVRQYGGAPALFLERKWSRRRRVRKRRVQATLADLGGLAEGRAGDVGQAWFLRDVRSHELAPVCRVRYLRRALFGVCSEGPMRVTFDRNIRGALAPGWSLDFSAEERRLLDGHVVCEFKYYGTIPSPMKAAIAALRLTPTGVSKYRTCVRAFAAELGVELPAPGAEVGRA